MYIENCILTVDIVYFVYRQRRLVQMRREDIIEALLDRHIFPEHDEKTISEYYQAIVDARHIHEDKMQEKSSKKKIYYILTKWNRGTPERGRIRYVDKRTRHNPRQARYDFHMGKVRNIDYTYHIV